MLFTNVLQALEHNSPWHFKCRIINAKWLELYYLFISGVPLGFIYLSLASTKHLPPVWWGSLYSTRHSLDFKTLLVLILPGKCSDLFLKLILNCLGIFRVEIGMIEVVISKGFHLPQNFFNIHPLRCHCSEAWQDTNCCVRSVSALQDDSTQD